jgi:hypothetical protein
MAATCRPLGVEVYSLTDPSILDGWEQPQCPRYRGLHGLRMPQREPDGSDYVGL